MKKIIGIDIDGVLTHEKENGNNIWQMKLAEYLDKDITRSKDEYNFKKAFNLTDRELEGFIDKHLANIYKNLKPAPGALDTLLKLRKLDFKIILITAREKEYKKITENWLVKYNIPYDSLYHEDNKAPLALDNNIQLFIEDNKNNALQLLKNNIPVILINKYHNQNIKEKENIYRVNNWQQIANIICELYDIGDKQLII